MDFFSLCHNPFATNKETIVQPSKSKTLVRTLIDAAGAAPKDVWMNIVELRACHPDHSSFGPVANKAIVDLHVEGITEYISR